MDEGKSIVVVRRDLSKMKILLCDIDAESCNEVLALLCTCSYQVVAVYTAKEVFDTINSQGPRADIILADVKLLMSNDAHLLRHIMHEKELRQIPVITRDQVSITIKGMRLGAAGYLVKPLHIDEISNLWMHNISF